MIEVMILNTPDLLILSLYQLVVYGIYSAVYLLSIALHLTLLLPWSRHLDDRAAQIAAPRFNCCLRLPKLDKLWRG